MHQIVILLARRRASAEVIPPWVVHIFGKKVKPFIYERLSVALCGHRANCLGVVLSNRIGSHSSQRLKGRYRCIDLTTFVESLSKTVCEKLNLSVPDVLFRVHKKSQNSAVKGKLERNLLGIDVLDGWMDESGLQSAFNHS